MIAFLILLLVACGEDNGEIYPIEPADIQEPIKEESDSTIVSAAGGHEKNQGLDSLSFLALGDSYTIGTGEEAENRWPVLLSDRLETRGFYVSDLRIVAAAGWTTRNLLSGINIDDLSEKYDMVSLLIGVNNQFQELDFGVFEREFLQLLSFAIRRAKSKDGVFVLSIPDYGVTPFGQYAEERISNEIDMYNEYIEKICSEEKIKFYNITQISRKAKYDLEYLAPDNLHPSKKMYEEWIDLIISNPPVFIGG